MQQYNKRIRKQCSWWLLAGLWTALGAQAQVQLPEEMSLEIYGSAHADFIYDFQTNDPDWFDVNRPSKLPSFPGEFGRDGHFYASVRPTRLGLHVTTPTDCGKLYTAVEFDWFGVGDEAGQTQTRLRLAYGQLGKFGAGQLWSPFMDLDVVPNTLDYWGPNGVLFFRNVQAFWQPLQGDRELVIALERPGATGDEGIFADRSDIPDVELRFPRPDLSAAYRHKTDWGYLRVAAIARYFKYDDLDRDDDLDLSGSDTGWGISLSSNVKPDDRNVLRLQAVRGAGVESYFNDAPVDIAPKLNFRDARRPVIGKVLPVWGATVYLDHKWHQKWSSSIGYSYLKMDNTNGQAPDAFSKGRYATANLRYYPTSQVMGGVELQWGKRNNFSDGFESEDVRLQFSFSYSFSYTLRDQSSWK
ncbi:DcaP family trimeric outer membrane transporter [Microbulbifer sp. TYP-18]|uniref:DcaP family trimeric outer membrane transporter n=1 Tax=Microbulbifer sp. TYP-18 TaxID=3230024 RepID=UPI0034C5ED1D